MKDVTREDRVSQFTTAAGKKPWDYTYTNLDASVLGMIKEEFFELWEATFDYEKNPHNLDARENLCKEWADLQYVVSQFAWYYDIPADASFNRVHENNMSKVVDGKVIFREDGKILKPEGYQPPDMSGL